MEELDSHGERKQYNWKLKKKKKKQASHDSYKGTRLWDTFQQVQRTRPHTPQRSKSNVTLKITIWPVGTCQIQFHLECTASLTPFL